MSYPIIGVFSMANDNKKRPFAESFNPDTEFSTSAPLAPSKALTVAEIKTQNPIVKPPPKKFLGFESREQLSQFAGSLAGAISGPDSVQGRVGGLAAQFAGSKAKASIEERMQANIKAGEEPDKGILAHEFQTAGTPRSDFIAKYAELSRLDAGTKQLEAQTTKLRETGTFNVGGIVIDSQTGKILSDEKTVTQLSNILKGQADFDKQLTEAQSGQLGLSEERTAAYIRNLEDQRIQADVNARTTLRNSVEKSLIQALEVGGSGISVLGVDGKPVIVQTMADFAELSPVDFTTYVQNAADTIYKTAKRQNAALRFAQGQITREVFDATLDALGEESSLTPDPPPPEGQGGLTQEEVDLLSPNPVINKVRGAAR